MNNEFLRQQNIPFEVKLKYLMQTTRFNVVGTVSKVYDEGRRVDITLPYLDCNLKPEVLKGIEVLRPGTHNIIVKYEPKIGDVALVFGMQDYWAEGKFAHQPEKQSVQAEPYSNVTMKAILVQTNEDNSNATIVELTDDELNIKTPLKVNVTVNGNEASVTCDKLTINNHLTVE